jgi:hypothetical protein
LLGLFSKLYWGTLLGIAWVAWSVPIRRSYALRITNASGLATILPMRFDSEESAHRAAATSLISELDYEVVEP